MKPRQGFSLIEIIAVVSLIAVVLSITSFRYVESFQAAQFRSTVERVVDFDFQSRRHAQSVGLPVRLSYELRDNTVDATRWKNGTQFARKIRLGSECSITSIETVAGPAGEKKFAVTISKLGAAVTYAIEFANDRQSTWVFFSGGTGKTIELDSREGVEALFRQLRLAGVS